MPQQQSIKRRAPSQRIFKKRLADSGYSEDAANKVWNWYIARIEKQRSFYQKAA